MKKIKFNKKDIIATDCKIVSEDENGIVLQMKRNNNESQKLSDLYLLEKVLINDDDYDDYYYERGEIDWLYFIAMVNMAIIAICIIILLIYQQFSWPNLCLRRNPISPKLFAKLSARHL